MIHEVIPWRERVPGWWLHRRIEVASGDHAEVVLGRLRSALLPADGLWHRRYGRYMVTGEADRYRVRVRAVPGWQRGGLAFTGIVENTDGGVSRLVGSIREPWIVRRVILPVGVVGLVLTMVQVEIVLLTSSVRGAGVRWMVALGPVALVAAVAGILWWGVRRRGATTAFLEQWLATAVAGEQSPGRTGAAGLGSAGVDRPSGSERPGLDGAARRIAEMPLCTSCSG